MRTTKTKASMLALALLAALGLGARLGMAAEPAAPAEEVPSCCAEHAGHGEDGEAAEGMKCHHDQAMTCTLTGKEVDHCCCEQREGKLYCPLAEREVDSCCCKPAAKS